MNGIGGVEMSCVLARLAEKFDGPVELLQADMLHWTWPQRFRKHGYGPKSASEVFSPKRAQSHGWKSSASEFLLVCPVVLFWLECNAASTMANETASFRNLADVIDRIIAIKNGVSNDLRSLDKSIRCHLQSRNRLYGDDQMTSKCHTALAHLVSQIEDDGGKVIDTLPLERGHQVPKGYGTTIKRDDQWEKAVLVRVIAWQSRALQAFDETPGLECAKWSDEFGGHVGNALHYEGVSIGIRDFVTIDGDVMQVALCGCYEDTLFILGTECAMIKTLSDRSVRVRLQDATTLVWMSKAVVPAHCWRFFADSHDVIVLLPFKLEQTTKNKIA